MLLRTAVAVLIALAASIAHAQELDIFELSDFMDPRLRGAQFDREGTLAISPGADFNIVRAVGGGVLNYDWRTRPTDTAVNFIHLVASHYSGLMQGNVKLTTMQAENGSSIPQYRISSQLARYMLTDDKNLDTGEIEKVAGRWLLTTALEQSRVCGSAKESRGQARVCHTHLDSEVGAQIDTEFPISRSGEKGTGSFIFAFRNTAEEGRIFRGTLVTRVTDKAFERTRVGIVFDASVERASSAWRFGAVRLGFSYAVDLAAGLAINFGWTPAFVTTEPGHRLHNEVAIFLDRTVFSKIIPRPKPR
jgi:hypothetical protein